MIFVLLIGCSTPYKSAGLTGGYSDVQLSKDIYKVSFRGNGFTSNEKVQDYLLYRCAQLTDSKGYKYFIVLAGNENHSDQIYTTPTTINTHVNGNIYSKGTARTNYYGYQSKSNFTLNGNTSTNANTTITQGTTYNIRKYTDTAVIKVLKNNKEFPNALSSEIILSNKF